MIERLPSLHRGPGSNPQPKNNNKFFACGSLCRPSTAYVFNTCQIPLLLLFLLLGFFAKWTVNLFLS